MVGRVGALVLVASVALADDAHMYQARKPELVGYPNWVLTPLGRERIAQELQGQAEGLERLKTENGHLRQKALELAAKPELTWMGALVLVGVGLVVGVAVGVPVALTVRR